MDAGRSVEARSIKSEHTSIWTRLRRDSSRARIEKSSTGDMSSVWKCEKRDGAAPAFAQLFSNIEMPECKRSSTEHETSKRSVSKTTKHKPE